MPGFLNNWLPLFPQFYFSPLFALGKVKLNFIISHSIFSSGSYITWSSRDVCEETGYLFLMCIHRSSLGILEPLWVQKTWTVKSAAEPASGCVFRHVEVAHERPQLIFYISICIKKGSASGNILDYIFPWKVSSDDPVCQWIYSLLPHYIILVTFKSEHIAIVVHSIKLTI